MAGHLVDIAEFEVERERELLDNSMYFGQSIKDMATLSEPGTFMCHEVSYMTQVLHDMVLAQLSDHPSILSKKAWYIKSRQIAHLLYELHTDILMEQEEGVEEDE